MGSREWRVKRRARVMLCLLLPLWVYWLLYQDLSFTPISTLLAAHTTQELRRSHYHQRRHQEHPNNHAIYSHTTTSNHTNNHTSSEKPTSGVAWSRGQAWQHQRQQETAGVAWSRGQACQHQRQQETNAPRLVVFWTPFWHQWAAWEDVLQHQGRLRHDNCPTWRCEFVWTEAASSARVTEADAVVFFSLDFSSRPLPPRSPRQLWIWLELEAPPISKLTTGAWAAAESDGFFFNLTMSYHHLSNIVVPSGYLLPLGIPHHCPLQPAVTLDKSSETFISYSEHMRKYDSLVKEKGRRLDKWLRAEAILRHHSPGRTFPGRSEEEAPNITGTTAAPSKNDTSDGGNKLDFNGDAIRGNTRQNSDYDDGSHKHWGLTQEEIAWVSRRQLAVWMASHCFTESRRETLVAQLQQHINVTTVGSCGQIKCGRNHLDTHCFRWLAGSHLFYFSFENALCDDYHTEKLWLPLEHGMVPVVYGGRSYPDILPFGSYIDVMAFPSAVALAAHLVYLANHPTVYLRHLQWRRYWRVRWPVPWCSLCARLHQPRPHSSHAHATLDSWWNTTSQCYEPLKW
ncbi:alpha-(1,3)-fucosyltransferase C-like [Procambarus clarkii]|uniref:alpha-(1,3)-fucosyltransferase C-like n=1 Tax=Procambarus clarkii TaxID=6728 RepID=UPI0037427BCA